MKMKKAKLFMMLALLVMGVSNVFAQNVTVRQTNGNLLAAVKNGGNSDSFFDLGGFATWKHEQLSLTMTTADADKGELTEYGQLKNPCNNIFKSSDNEHLIIGRGNLDDCYIAIALPKGYRFTEYNITFSRNVTYTQELSGDTYYGTYGNASFGETDGSFGSYNKGRDTYKTGITYSNAGNNAPEYTIKRKIDNNDENGNVLYFKLTNDGNNNGRMRGRAFITLKHVELYFTAEADYTPVAANNVTANGASAVDIPFSTSKVDYGTLAKRTKNGTVSTANTARMSYMSAQLEDILANLTLYEAESYRDNTAAERAAWDGVEGKVVNYVTSGHSIYSVDDYFKLGGKKKTDEETGKEVDDEQIYFIETPVYVESGSNNHKNPIGYRIVGAQFDYTSSAGEYIPAQFYIQDETGYQAWYLGTNGQFQSTYSPVLWSIDQDGYISGNGYYMYVSGTTLSFQSISQGKPSADVGTFEISNNQIRRKNQQQYLCFYYTGDGQWATSATAYISEDSENRVVYNQQRAASGDLTTVGNYTIKIYDRTGKNVLKEIEVKDGNLSGTTELFEGFNNDAIKFGVIGTGLIKGHLTLQALDPYIDRLDIVCQEDDGNGSRAVQQFTSTDFSVKGGKFTFYVPVSFQGNCVFSFENLYSKYGDETYYDGSGEGNARYSLVMSPYWANTTNVYNTNPNHTYTDKIWTETVGKYKYKFNNAEQFSGTQPKAGDFEEYVFNPHLYGDGLNGNEQNFIKFFFTPQEINHEKTAYLFTCDETRYNIAPTTGIQHTYYAYYEMDITLKKQNYTPKLTWTKVYDDGETFYGEGNDLSKIKSDSQWGLKLETTAASEDGDNGYLTTKQIIEAIDGAVNKDGAPTSKHQILYIDASPLQSIVKSQKTKTLVTPAVENEDGTTTPAKYTYTFYELEDLQYKDAEGTTESNYIGKNALIYLPLNSTSSGNNFAIKTRDKEGNTTFHASNDIVITDRYPFFAPYDISVDGANYAVYERTLTNPKYGQINHASIVLPFTISIKDGVHTNPDNKGGQEFKLSQMNGTKALSKNGYDYTTDGYFTNLTSDSEANKPYVVSFTTKTDEDEFMIWSKGAYIYTTPTHTSIKENGVFEGETGTGTYEGTYNFTHKGSFTGKKIANAKTKNVFYFSNNKFVNSATLGNGVDVYQLPFRTVYNYTFTPSSNGNNAKLNAFRIVFGENPDMSDTNGINEVQRDADLAVIPGDGCITLMARADKDVTIHAVNGMTVDKCTLRAGDSRTVNVPAGVYVINGVKMVVK